MGGRSIACLNARDRNLLGFRRDLLTAAAYGVDQFLFVYGDRPTLGARTGQLTVQSMLRELRAFPETHAAHGWPSVPGRSRGRCRSAAGMETRRRLPLRAGALLARRAARMARRDRVRRTGVRGRHGRAERGDGAQDLRRRPAARGARRWVHAIERDPDAGVELACDLVAGVRASGAFDGVHLIPVNRYREVAARLEMQFAGG